MRMEREHFRQRLYIGRDLLISGRTGLRQPHLTLWSLPHHLYSPFHTSVHAHTHSKAQWGITALVPVQSLSRGSTETTASQGVSVKRHPIPEAPFHTGWLPSSLTASCNGSQEVTWTRGAGEESFLMAAGLHNHTYWVSFSHDTRGSNPYHLFPWSPERGVYDLGSAASSVSQHVPPQGVGQFSKATSSRAEGSRWRQPPSGDPVAGSWLSGSIMG